MGMKRYKRDFKALERRRHNAAQLLSRGMPQAEVARQVGVSRQSVSAWARALADDKQAWRRKPLGVPPVFVQSRTNACSKKRNKAPWRMDMQPSCGLCNA